MGKRKIIDISTEEKKKETFDRFDSFTSKNQAHEYFGISDNKQGSEYLREIASSVGFDLTLYKERKIIQLDIAKNAEKKLLVSGARIFAVHLVQLSITMSAEINPFMRKLLMHLGKNLLKK